MQWFQHQAKWVRDRIAQVGDDEPVRAEARTTAAMSSGIAAGGATAGAARERHQGPAHDGEFVWNRDALPWPGNDTGAVIPGKIQPIPENAQVGVQMAKDEVSSVGKTEPTQQRQTTRSSRSWSKERGHAKPSATVDVEQALLKMRRVHEACNDARAREGTRPSQHVH